MGNNGAALRQLRTLFSMGMVGDLTDGQLLERFLTSEGEPAELAFACLVDRHGAMVLRVCQSVLANAHDAQDAFQATFLVLARKARALWVRDSLGPWLHQTAYRTALCARAREARRRRHERQAARPEAVEPRPAHFINLELERALHEEIQKLPNRFRAPLVLCDLEGQSHEQAAGRLGCPVGTIKSRLARGRERLRGRLLRRGLAPDAVATAPSVSSTRSASSPNAVLSTLTGPTAAIAARLLNDRGGLAAGTGAVLSLAQGAIRSMFVTQVLKTASAFLIVGATVAGTSAVAVGSGWFAQADAPSPKRHAKIQDSRIQDPRIQDPRIQDPRFKNSKNPGPKIQASLEKPAAESQQTPQAPAAAYRTVETVKAGKLPVTVDLFAGIASAANHELRSSIRRPTTILKIVASGTQVQKGDIVCELDSAALRDDLVNQRAATESARDDYTNAQFAREVAEIAVVEYKEGISKQELSTIEGDIRLAESDASRSEDILALARRARKQMDDEFQAKGGPKSPVEIQADYEMSAHLAEAELKAQSAKLKVDREKGKRELLVRFTVSRKTKQLEAEVEKSHRDEFALRAKWDLEKTRLADLEKQIKACTLKAPVSGTVHFNTEGVQPSHRIEEGATVHERQVVLTVSDPSTLIANLNVPVPYREKFAPGMTLSMFANGKSLRGTVLAKSSPWPTDARIQVAPVPVRIDEGPKDLREGTASTLDIVIGTRDNALSVPKDAVVQFRDATKWVAVKTPEGKIDWREVLAGGQSRDRQIIKFGIKEGDQVVLHPAPFLSDEQRSMMGGTQ